MSNPYPAQIATPGGGPVKVAGDLTFTDPANQPGGSSAAHGAAVTLTGGTVVASGALVPWDHVNRDTDSYYDAAAHQFVVPAGLGGLYLVSCQVAVVAAATSVDVVGAISPSFPNIESGLAIDQAGNFVGGFGVALELPVAATVEFDLDLAGAPSGTVSSGLSFASLAYLGALT